jgi:hypothetical protein
MAKYRVVLVRTIKQSFLVEVEADDEDEAVDEAERVAYTADGSRWEYVDEDDFGVDSIELVSTGEGETQAQRDVDGAWMDNLGESPDF